MRNEKMACKGRKAHCFALQQSAKIILLLQSSNQFRGDSIYIVGWNIFVDMKFSLYLRLDSYRENIIHKIISATLCMCAYAGHVASICMECKNKGTI